jgi:hypothetical protein
MELEEATIADIVLELRSRPLYFALVFSEDSPDFYRGVFNDTGDNWDALRQFRGAVDFLTDHLGGGNNLVT